MTEKPRAADPGTTGSAPGGSASADPAENRAAERVVIRDKRKIRPGDPGFTGTAANTGSTGPAADAESTGRAADTGSARSEAEAGSARPVAEAGAESPGKAETVDPADAGTATEPVGAADAETATEPVDAADIGTETDEVAVETALAEDSEEVAEAAEAEVAGASGSDSPVVDAPAEPVVETPIEPAEEPAAGGAGGGVGALGAELEALRSELDERIRDLQRVSAEYANYRKRVDRDRGLVAEQTTGTVLVALLPILDDLDRAREHGDLVGPFGTVAEQLTSVVGKLGLTAFGEKGDPFDPTRHEAVAHLTSAEVTEPTCVDVMRRGYLLGERLLRAALVAVADPE